MTTNENVDVVKGFFAAFGRGDLEGIVGAFHPRAAIIAVRAGARAKGGLYGTFEGKEGAREFVSTLGALFETRAFDVREVIGAGDVVFASGSFEHLVKATGRTFRSDWALRCVVSEGTIAEYRFYEDSAAFVEASR